DIITLKGVHKIIGMVSASLIPILFGLRLNYLEIVMHNQLVLCILTLVWIYGMINAFNFMDGIDGLIGGVTVVSCLFLMGFGLMGGNYLVTTAALILMASCFGFLFFNYSPATVFLGDVGSMFIGYNLAALSIMLVNQSGNQIPIYVCILIFGVIIFDAMVTFIRRGIEGKNVLAAHREHLYQRLIIIGFSHRDVSIIYYLLSITLGVAAVIFFKFTLIIKILVALLGLLILILFSFTVCSLEKKYANK
ncbi:glycosyltransferase family 4 protein, partial [Candidatus Margulisiibacteriota bacterium]